MEHFGTTDYVVFIGMLIMSAVIGIYYACAGGKQKTSGEFLMANREMGIVPISLSMLASFLSGISLIGAPAEVYLFGYMIYVMMFGAILSIIAATVFYLPVFYTLQATSAYEYLEKRFHRVIRTAACIIYIFQMVIYMAIVTYAPALALSQVTGLHPWACVGAIGGVCIFYTTIGGMKAVMWTDAIQIIIMFTSMICVVIKGTIEVGGFGFVIDKNIEGKRLHKLEISWDPTVRHTFWGLFFGGFFNLLATYVLLNIPGFILMKTVCCFAGFILYAKYWNCDPKSSGRIMSSDQMIPILVMDLLSNAPGVPGLFVAGVFSGSLSTLSSGLNSLAAITLEDLIKTTYSSNISDETGAKISKFLAVFFGCLCISMVAVAERLGNIAQATISVIGITSGPLLGLFTMGMFVPWANTWGAAIGFVISMLFVGWIGIGAQISQAPKPYLPVSVDGCNITANPNITIERLETEVFYLYRISYIWYSAIAFTVFIVIGLLVSCITGCTNQDNMNPNLFNCIGNKFLHKTFPEKCTEMHNHTNMETSLEVCGSVGKACENNSAYENTENAVTKI